MQDCFVERRRVNPVFHFFWSRRHFSWASVAFGGEQRPIRRNGWWAHYLVVSCRFSVLMVQPSLVGAQWIHLCCRQPKAIAVSPVASQQCAEKKKRNEKKRKKF